MKIIEPTNRGTPLTTSVHNTDLYTDTGNLICAELLAFQPGGVPQAWIRWSSRPAWTIWHLSQNKPRFQEADNPLKWKDGKLFPVQYSEVCLIGTRAPPNLSLQPCRAPQKQFQTRTIALASLKQKLRSSKIRKVRRETHKPGKKKSLNSGITSYPWVLWDYRRDSERTCRRPQCIWRLMNQWAG